MGKAYPPHSLRELYLFPHAVLGKTEGAGELSERERLGEAVSPAEAHVRQHLISRGDAGQYLLPLVERAAPTEGDVVVGKPLPAQRHFAIEVEPCVEILARLPRRLRGHARGAQQRHSHGDTSHYLAQLGFQEHVHLLHVRHRWFARRRLQCRAPRECASARAKCYDDAPSPSPAPLDCES